MTVCKHCGSPSQENGPCWHWLHREYDGSDAPCLCDVYDSEDRADQRKWLAAYGGIAVTLVVATALALFWTH